MNALYLITGSNIGDRKKNLKIAANAIEKETGNIVKRSSIYETEPWGNIDQASFYNQVLLVESPFSATEIMKKILVIEKKMGRIRTIKNAARIIDIDILFFNNEVINEPSLVIPHKEIANRRFVLMPLNELSPELIHPVLKKSIRELLTICNDPLRATLLADG